MDKSLEAIVQSTESWLANPVQKDIEGALQTSRELVVDLVALIKEENAPKQQIGPLLAKVKGTKKAIENLEMMNWVELGGGHLAIGHRPSTKMGIDLKLQNATHILTLLSEGEQAKTIRSIAIKNSLGWLWFPMESAQPPVEGRYQELAELFKSMQAILDEGGKIYLHCSAGIHRTGMIGFAFLRFLGKDASQSMEMLKALRVKTSEEVGDERVAWGNDYAKLFKN
ncbi:MAG: hypothetical protein R8G66_16370 [Cytophagales bacterium]|nr:hypothetical protein [Cytophagales bacterium]